MDPFRKQSMMLLGGLALQFLLGIFNTLFVEFPDTKDPNQLWEFAKTQVPLGLHILVGLGLLIGSTSLLYRAIKTKNSSWRNLAAVGLISLVTAFVSGALFISTQNDQLSFLMAVGFIVAVITYAWGIYSVKS